MQALADSRLTRHRAINDFVPDGLLETEDVLDDAAEDED